MSIAPIAIKLPAAYTQEIGTIISHWAYVEWRFRQIVYRLLDIDPKRGRVAVRAPRAKDLVATIADLALLSKIEIKINLTKLKTDIAPVNDWRDKIAHGIWVKLDTEDFYRLQITSGKWDKPRSGYRTKRLMPEGAPMPPNRLKEILADVDSIALRTEQLWQEIDATLPRSKKTHGPHPQDDPLFLQSQKPKKSKTPRISPRK
ncbi:MAG: hypothetical protein SGJ07_08000 [Rhodospirillaceae bacterium]|nr:hypothetical protein [Rhodospirillaceae bacterium]